MHIYCVIMTVWHTLCVWDALPLARVISLCRYTAYIFLELLLYLVNCAAPILLFYVRFWALGRARSDGSVPHAVNENVISTIWKDKNVAAEVIGGMRG